MIYKTKPEALRLAEQLEDTEGARLPTWQDMLGAAEQLVRQKPTFSKYIRGTVLENDVPVWIADFAQRLLIHAMHALERCEQRNEAMRAEVDEWKRVAAAQAELHGEAEERAEQLAEDDAWCAECGVKLENVRPGKHQHPTCSQAALQRHAAVAQPLTDEALLRQALEWIEAQPELRMIGSAKLITALKERPK